MKLQTSILSLYAVFSFSQFSSGLRAEVNKVDQSPPGVFFHKANLVRKGN